MSVEIGIMLKAVDEASSVVSGASEAMTKSLAGVEEAGKNVSRSSAEITKSAKGLVTGLSGVATSAFALYNAWDNVQDMQVSVDRANLAVKSSLNALEDAQNRYNSVVEKYGADSSQAQAALADLNLAQERYQVAVERADMVQGNYNETIMRSALSIIPIAITMIDSVAKATKSWAAIQQILNVVMNANPIMLIVTGIGLLIAALAIAYTTCEPFRNAVDGLAKTLGDFFKPILDKIVEGLTWLGSVILGAGKVLSDLWNIVSTNPILSALLGPVTMIGYLFKNWEQVTRAVGDALSWFHRHVIEPITNAINAFANAVRGALNWLGSLVNKANTAVGSVSRLREEVGEAPSTGLVKSLEDLAKTASEIKMPTMVERGLGRGGIPSMGALTVNVNLNVASVTREADEERLARTVAEKVAGELYRRYR